MSLLVPLAFIFGFGGSAPPAADLPAATQLEIDALLTRLGLSDCRFYRNGQWYDGEAAQAHLRMKYEYLLKKGWVHSTEEFIERAGTQSSLSSEPYQVQCANHPPVKSAEWLTDQVRQRRMAFQDRKP